MLTLNKKKNNINTDRNIMYYFIVLLFLLYLYFYLYIVFINKYK